ncbi:MAG: hybrid sensor histidine kinase/response regulator [Thermoanaerobaculia bacterium]
MNIHPREPESGSRLRVLILEDNLDDAELVLRELRRGGFEPEWSRVQTAEDFGAELQKEWDIILSDFSMPRFNAFGALEILEGRRDAPPLIVVSGTIGEDTAVAAIKAGAADYLMKDRLSRLGAAIRRELRERAVRRIHEADQRRAQESIKTLLSALEQTVDSIILTDPEGKIQYVNPGFQRLYGYSSAETLGRTPRILKSGVHDSAFYKAFWRSLMSDGGFHGEIVNRARDGRLVTVESSAKAIFDDSGKRSGFIAVYHDVSEKTRAAEALRDSERRYRALAARIEQVREDERTGIARELHDELGQALTAMKMDLVATKRNVASDDETARGAAAKKIDSTIELIDGMVVTVRRISSEMRPGMLDDLGLFPAIEWLANDFSQRTGIACRLKSEVGSPSPGGARATAVYRIFQEALTNVARHSKATEVQVRLSDTDAILCVEVHDNGKGFVPEVLSDSSSLGLIGMRERAASIGGEVTFVSEPGAGATMLLRVPLSGEEGP